MKAIKVLLTRAMRGELSRLDTLYQRHAGQECYVFGTGISLKWMDLRQFVDRPSILAGFMIYHKEANVLDIPYCSLTEPFWFWSIYPDSSAGQRQIVRHSVHQEYRKSIRGNPRTTFFLNFSNYPVARFPNALYVSRFYKPPFEKNNPFRERVDSYAGTLKFQISLAIYLGFKKAYLVGHDYTHSPARALHFYEKGEGILQEHEGFCQEFIDYAKKYIELVTVTLGAGSKTMDSISYQDFTGKEPCFRENTDIVDAVKLESLVSWKLAGYSIF